MMCHLIYESQEGGFIEKVIFDQKQKQENNLRLFHLS